MIFLSILSQTFVTPCILHMPHLSLSRNLFLYFSTFSSVVLAIRGTLSLEDCVIDVLLEPESLEELGQEHGFNAEGQHCHSEPLLV